MTGDGVKHTSGDKRDSYTFNMERLAAQFKGELVFSPAVTTDKFMLSEISLHSIPKGSWLLPRTSDKVPAITNPVYTVDGGDKADYVYSEQGATMKRNYFDETVLQWEESALQGGLAKTTFSLFENGGDKADYVYSEQGATMKRNYFDETVLQWEESALQGGLAKTTFSLFENRRGTLDTAAVAKPVNWPELGDRSPEEFLKYAQFEKRSLAEKAGFNHATYLKLKGVYQTGVSKFETTYYVYLGENPYSEFNVKRNTRYNMTVTIRSKDDADSRIDKITLNDMKVYYNESQVVDAHFNAVQTLLYAPGDWEMWVEEADEHPWLE